VTLGVFSKATILRNMNEVSARNIRIICSILTLFDAAEAELATVLPKRQR